MPPLPRAVLLPRLPKDVEPLINSYADDCAVDAGFADDDDWVRVRKALGLPCARCQRTCGRECLGRIRRCKESRRLLLARLTALSQGATTAAALLAKAYVELQSSLQAAAALATDAGSHTSDPVLAAYARYVHAMAGWDGGGTSQPRLLRDCERAATRLLPEDAAFAYWVLGESKWTEGDLDSARSWFRRQLAAAPGNTALHLFALRELMWVALADGDDTQALEAAANMLDRYAGGVSYREAAWVGAAAVELLLAHDGHLPTVGRRAFSAISLELGDQAAQRLRGAAATAWYEAVAECGRGTVAWGPAFAAIRDPRASEEALRGWAGDLERSGTRDGCPRGETVLDALETRTSRGERLAKATHAPSSRDALVRAAVDEAVDTCLSMLSHGRLDWLAAGWHIRVVPRTGAVDVLNTPGSDRRFRTMAVCVGSLLRRYVGGEGAIEIEVAE